MVFNAIFNNISVTSWWSVLIMEETGVPRGNHWHATSHWQTLSCNVASGTPRLSRIRTHKKQVWDLILTRLVVQDKSNTQLTLWMGQKLKFLFSKVHIKMTTLQQLIMFKNVLCQSGQWWPVVSEWSMVACWKAKFFKPIYYILFFLWQSKPPLTGPPFYLLNVLFAKTCS